MYLALKRLEKHNAISAYWGDQSQSHGGRRKYYTLTGEGRQLLETHISSWKLMSEIVNRFI
ncbi:Transcriptional regulator PadR-like family protein [compost metagenome]